MPPAKQPPAPDPDEPTVATPEVTEPVADPEPEAEPGSLENPIVVAAVADDAPLGVAPITRAQAIANAEAIASQQSLVRAGASSPVGTEQLQRLRTDYMDQWDSRWNRS